jgi:phosphotransferase system HPr-like phosphotransfer protein
MNEAISKILKMVEEGKIDAAKAAELIDAISNKKEEEAAAPKAQSEKMLKIRVLSGAGEKVNIKLPIKFIKTGLKAFGKIPINIDGDEEQRIDVQAIAHAIENDIEGKIVDCCTSKGDNVEIVIE